MIVYGPPPAIIYSAPIEEVRFGLSVVIGRIDYDRFVLPRDFRDASFEELKAWFPRDLWENVPHWLLLSMLPGMANGALLGGSLATTSATTFITTTSGADQTYNVPATFVSNTSGEIVTAGGHGWEEGTDGCGNGLGNPSAGGSGGYVIANAMTGLVAGSTTKFRLRAASAGSGSANACWFGGTSLAGSKCGMECGANVSVSGSSGSGASTTGAIGTATAGTNGPVPAAVASPPAAAQTARSGSGVATAGDGGTDAISPGQGIIKIVNVVTA